jgi:hypothetical protein
MKNNDRSYDLDFMVDSKLNEIENSKKFDEKPDEIPDTGAEKQYLFNGSTIEILWSRCLFLRIN